MQISRRFYSGGKPSNAVKKLKKDKRYYGYADSPDLKPKNVKRFLKQIEKRGFDDTEVYNLDVAASKFLLPRLERFLEVNNGHPDSLTFSQWKKTIEKMIFGFKYFANQFEEQVGGQKKQERDFKKAQEGVELFAKYFTHIWW